MKVVKFKVCGKEIYYIEHEKGYFPVTLEFLKELMEYEKGGVKNERS